MEKTVEITVRAHQLSSETCRKWNIVEYVWQSAKTFGLHMKEDGSAYLLIRENSKYAWGVACTGCCVGPFDAKCIHDAAKKAGVKTIFGLGKARWLADFIDPPFETMLHRDVPRLYKEVIDPFYSPSLPARIIFMDSED